jgi:hypothetical protein
MRSLATLALLGLDVVVAAPDAEGRRPAPPGEPTMMRTAI